MKRFLAALFLFVLLVLPTVAKKKDPPPVSDRVVSIERERAGVGAILIPNPNPSNGDGMFAQICSGSEIGYDSDGNGLFLTARHCVYDEENGTFMHPEVVSFNPTAGGPYYTTELYAISQDEDLALLKVHNAANVPIEVLGDENELKVGDPIENVSYPLDMGKLEFHGTFIAPVFPHWTRLFADYPQWRFSMPVDITIAHGSSGSSIFDSKTGAIIGVLVGTTGEGRLNIAEPISRYWVLVNNLDKNSVDAFLKSHPPVSRFQTPPDDVVQYRKVVELEISRVVATAVPYVATKKIVAHKG
jgi:S1-C subfamily serine protease